ncbi:MAG: glycosyltransferase [Rhodospirillaceae bacterium]
MNSGLCRLIILRSLTTAAVLAVVVLLPVRLLRRSIRALIGGRRISLWGGTPIINMAINARAERRLGARTASIVYDTYFITSDFDIVLRRWLDLRIAGRLVPFLTFIAACLLADRLHFYLDRGFLPVETPFAINLQELTVYRWLGIPVFLWTYGADVRTEAVTRSLGEPNCCMSCAKIGVACICDQSLQIAHYQQCRKLVTAVFAMGDMLEYTPGSRNDLYFWPVDIDGSRAEKYRPAYPVVTTEPLRIVHAPNHRAFKGSDLLIAAVEKLRAEGVPLELVLVERVPNERALEIYRTADVIFDQCLIGFHGYFALEGLAMGKPVMCYIRKPELYLLAPDECPIILTGIATLEFDLRRIVLERNTLPEIGRRGRRYIERYHTPPAFAGRLKQAYSDLGVLP